MNLVPILQTHFFIALSLGSCRGADTSSAERDEETSNMTSNLTNLTVAISPKLN